MPAGVILLLFFPALGEKALNNQAHQYIYEHIYQDFEDCVLGNEMLGKIPVEGDDCTDCCNNPYEMFDDFLPRDMQVEFRI